MVTLKTDVALQDSLYEKITAIAQEMKISQDELVGLAIAEYVQKHQQSTLRAKLIQALQEDVANLEYQAELRAWDSVAGDGIDAEG
jgi:predicted transcriptional regulator